MLRTLITALLASLAMAGCADPKRVDDYWVQHEYKEVRNVSGGISFVYEDPATHLQGLWSGMKRDPPLTPPIYERIEVFDDGLAIVSKTDGKGSLVYGLLKGNGEELVSPQYADIGTVKDRHWTSRGALLGGFAPFAVSTTAGIRWGYLSTDGKVAVPAQYVAARDVCEWRAAVGRETPAGVRFGVLDMETLKPVVDFTYLDISPFRVKPLADAGPKNPPCAFAVRAGKDGAREVGVLDAGGRFTAIPGATEYRMLTRPWCWAVGSGSAGRYAIVQSPFQAIGWKGDLCTAIDADLVPGEEPWYVLHFPGYTRIAAWFDIDDHFRAVLLHHTDKHRAIVVLPDGRVDEAFALDRRRDADYGTLRTASAIAPDRETQLLMAKWQLRRAWRAAGQGDTQLASAHSDAASAVLVAAIARQDDRVARGWLDFALQREEMHQLCSWRTQRRLDNIEEALRAPGDWPDLRQPPADWWAGASVSVTATLSDDELRALATKLAAEVPALAAREERAATEKEAARIRLAEHIAAAQKARALEEAARAREEEAREAAARASWSASGSGSRPDPFAAHTAAHEQWMWDQRMSANRLYEAEKRFFDYGKR